MKGLKLNLPLLLKSGRKGAVVDIDIIIAYLVFISTIILMTNYSLRLTAPFATSINSLEKEKNTLAIRDEIITHFSINDFADVCDLDYLNLRRLSVSYEIKGFNMPFTDSNNFSPATINGSLVFQRQGEELRVKTGSVDLAKTINAQIIIPNSVSVYNVSLDTGDSFEIDFDPYDNVVVIFDSTVEDGDVDELIIEPVNGLVSFWINGVELSDCYIGDLKLNDYCGTRGISGTRTSFNRYGLMTDDYTSYYVKLVGDIWWTN